MAHALFNKGWYNVRYVAVRKRSPAFTINGFNSLKNIDKQFCRPFDQQRNGLNLGEGRGLPCAGK